MSKVAFVFAPIFVSLLASLIPLKTVAADAESADVVVEASAINEEKIEPSRTSTIIDSSQIRSKQPSTVAEILREIPGVEIVRQGGPGQTTSIFIRGARSEDTLVLIDGGDASDFMLPSGGFDFSNLSPENIERIEVYRGPQSVRFGAGALGGVINIVTREGRGENSLHYLAETGSFGTNKISLGDSVGGRHIGFSFNVDRFYSNGISAADEVYGNLEHDKSETSSASGKLNWHLNPKAEGALTLRYSKSNVDVDRHGGVGGDDPNDTTASRQLMSGISESQRFFDDRLKSTLGIYFTEVDRSGSNSPDPADSTTSTDHFLSESRKVESNNDLLLGESHTLRLGLQWRDESGTSDSMYNGSPTNVDRKSQSSYGSSLTYLFDNDLWFGDIGARTDRSSVAGSISSQRVSIGRYFNSRATKTSVSYGTGFKLPSLYQLYSSYGDSSLHQEMSNAFEATVEQKLMRATATLTYFENRFRDLIDFNSAISKYFNVASARGSGFESHIDTPLPANLHILGTYTYLDARDESTGLTLLRRPYDAVSLSLRYSQIPYEAYITYRFKGERADIDPTTFARTSDGAYQTVDIGGSAQLYKQIKFFARFENVLDAKYEEVAGYGTPGASCYAGLMGDIP